MKSLMINDDLMFTQLLKAFEKRDKSLMAKASTNLSFLYFLEGDNELALKYADHAVKHQRYNAKALVNLGNCLFMQVQYLMLRV